MRVPLARPFLSFLHAESKRIKFPRLPRALDTDKKKAVASIDEPSGPAKVDFLTDCLPTHFRAFS